ncbi:hypothetical protein QE152_g4973 [Popillia japonica]|uniref:Uncharacterized protein n=1 Tax=Popillia japonica TaxID=7064 RepID=A0AAW1MZR4_POPJA
MRNDPTPTEQQSLRFGSPLLPRLRIETAVTNRSVHPLKMSWIERTTSFQKSIRPPLPGARKLLLHRRWISRTHHGET